MSALARGCFLLLASALLTACGPPPVDLREGLQIDVVETGWHDAGVVAGKNKLVPFVSFTITNLSDQELVGLQMMGSFFRVVDTSSEWGNAVLSVARSEGLAPGATTPVLTIRSPLGYTGEESRAEMIENSHFVDALVRLVAKYGSVQWAHVKEVPIDRQLLTQ